jgi:hypothetical protein
VRPTFNVTEFQDIVSVQMNDAMRHLLINFIDDIDDTEIEIRAFRNALQDPQGANYKKAAVNGTRKSYRRPQSADR